MVDHSKLHHDASTCPYPGLVTCLLAQDHRMDDHCLRWRAECAGLVRTAPPDAVTDDLSVSRPEGLRLLALGAILLGIYFALPIVGMVWVSMIAFALLVLLSGGKHLAWGMIAAVVLPLLLYFFFTKVAGVAIPQGQIVRLP